MPACERVRRRKKKICVGDLDTKIIIKRRTSGAQGFSATNQFAIHSEPFALWETVRGIAVFDEANTQTTATEMVIIRYDAAVTKEFFVELDSINYRILSAENIDKRDEWTELLLTSRGDKSLPVNNV